MRSLTFRRVPGAHKSCGGAGSCVELLYYRFYRTSNDDEDGDGDGDGDDNDDAPNCCIENRRDAYPKIK
jgi:hypothetical protein